METKTIGDKIAEDFSNNKVFLTEAEKRYLATAIDSKLPKPPVKPWAKRFREMGLN